VPTYFRATDLSEEAACGPRRPVAQDVAVTTPDNEAITIALQATDDGLPDPPGALTYVITSLPLYALADAGNGYEITDDDLPYTLVGGGHEVTCGRFGPRAIQDSFQYQVDDGGSAPEGGLSNTATVTITVGTHQTIYTFSFDEDPNWTREGDWAFGVPLGGGAYAGDPESGYTGDNVFGYNLAGDYGNSIDPPHFLTSSAIDCSGLWRTELRFRRWLGIESSMFDQASVQVSDNASGWTVVWLHSGAAVHEAAWSEQTVSIAGIADGKETVYVRWGMGPTDGHGTAPGWNIDDVEIRALPEPGPLGDMNCDGEISYTDINPFVDALHGPDRYYANQPDCDILYADVNVDGVVGFTDIGPFVELIVGY
jgi:hypothetical protein